MIDWSAMTTLVVERLQSAGISDYPVSEVKNAVNYALAEVAKCRPNKVGISFKLEGRKGTATSTSADNLVDTTKGQFVAADATDEKVIKNTTDYTWAVVLSQSSTSQIGLSADIMASNENYEMYNKRCANHRQLFIGDVPSAFRVTGVEFPIGTRRNWQQDGDILEVDIDRVPDTNSNTAVVNGSANAEVMVNFGLPHSLPNLTDWSATFSATAAVAATSIALTALQGAGTIDTGTIFNIENHRMTYVVSSSVTIASSAVTVGFYPPLESAVASTGWAVTIKKSSIEPEYEDLVAEIAAGRAKMVRSGEFLNSINIGGGQVYQNFYSTGKAQLEDALKRLRMSVPPKKTRRYPSSV